MTLAGLMKLALRQLDEQIEDIGEYEELFRSYANMGYMIALRLFYKPRESFCLETDGEGRAHLCGLPIMRIVSAEDENGRNVWFEQAGDGASVITSVKEGRVILLCETEYPPLETDLDEPKLPAYAHPALADYICYRHLSSGSLTKQSRAEFFYQSFYQQMRALRPQGAGSVTRMKNLYSATAANTGGC